MRHRVWNGAAVAIILSNLAAADTPEADWAYYHEGDLAGSLKSESPLPIYDSRPEHLWNRLFAALYIRPSHVPSQPGGPAVKRIEGGDWIDFFGWAGTTYWSEPAVCERLSQLLDEFLDAGGARLVNDPLRRAIFQRDLWAAYDFLIGQNIARVGDREAWRRRDRLCRQLARAIQALALSREAIGALPDNYEAAVASEKFAVKHGFDPQPDYLPPRLLSNPNEWVEVDFFRPNLHSDIEGRFITLHTRAYRGRSYFRIFYRFPEGRPQLEEYLAYADSEAVDWRLAAQNGFIELRKEIRQIPAGTELALVQFMMALDDRLVLTPTRIVESVRLRVFKNVDGSRDPATNTRRGMNVYEYTMKRRLLFNGLRSGGLEREPDEWPQYRVIFQEGRDVPDWGHHGRQATAEQCRSCHMSGGNAGAHTIFSLVNQGGFDAGAQLGIAVPLGPTQRSPRGDRAARWKTDDETYRRLLEYLEAPN